MQTLGSLIFLVKTAVKFVNLSMTKYGVYKTNEYLYGCRCYCISNNFPREKTVMQM